MIIANEKTRCQYIEDEPSADDACKCLEPVKAGYSYCDAHASLCWQVLQPREVAAQ